MFLLRLVLSIVTALTVILVGIFAFQEYMTESFLSIGSLVSVFLVLLVFYTTMAVSIYKESTFGIIISALFVVLTCLWMTLVHTIIGLTMLIGGLSFWGLFLTYKDDKLEGMAFNSLFAIGISVVLVIFYILSSLFGPMAPPSEAPPILKVLEYSAVLDEYESDSGEFILTEAWVVQRVDVYPDIKDYDPTEPIMIEDFYYKSTNSTINVQLQTRDNINAESLPITIMPFEDYLFKTARSVESNKDGFLVSKCEFTPLNMSYIWTQSHESGKYSFISNLNGDRYADNTRIEVNLPKGSFLNAKAESDVLPYGSIDIATWSLPSDSLIEPTGFLFVAPPWHEWRWLFSPFIGISSFGEAVPIALKIFLPLVGGTLLIFFRNYIIELLQRCFKRKKSDAK